jgi:hypothetical protein
MPIFYACIASILLIASTILFLFEGRQYDRIIGRYIEPAVPIIMILGIICLSNFDQRILNKKNILYFTLVSIPIILIMPYIFAWDNIIINVFNDLQDNPTLYAYNIFYGYSTLKAFTAFYNQNFIVSKQEVLSYLLPSLLTSAYLVGSLALITLSMRKKRYINLLLVFIILSSLAFSTTLYNISVTKSNNEDNSIARYLANYTNDGTIYLADLATSYNNARTEVYIYGFWNQGDISYINSGSIPQNITQRYKKAYLISPNKLPYNKVVIDGNFTLYNVV